MTSRITTLSFANQIIALENKLNTLDHLSLALSGKVYKLFRKIEKADCFRELQQERRLLPHRVFIHPNASNAKEKIGEIISFIKKGVIVCSIFSRVEKEKRKEIFHEIWPICNSVMSPDGLISLPIRLLKVQETERSVIFQALRLVSLDGQSYGDICQLLDLLKKIDPKDREDIASLAHDLKEHLVEDNHSVDNICKVISALKFLPTDIRQNIYEIPPEVIQATQNEFSLVQIILSSHREIKATHLYLTEKIHQLHSEKIAKHYVTPLLEQSDSFMLSIDNPLFELAFTAKDYIDNLANAKNPYTVFSNQLASIESKLQIANQIEDIQDIQCFINFRSLRKYCSSLFPKATIQDHLGAVYSERHFTQIIENMQYRVCCLESNQKELLFEYVSTSLSDTYENLCTNLKDPFFLSLFSNDKSTEWNAKEMSFQCILHYFSHLPDVASGESALTEREETLLKFSESVKDCRTGKEEGLITFYQHLPKEYKFTHSSQNSLNPNIVKAKISIFSVMENYVNDLISTASPFMLELTGLETDIPQLAHHSLYVKNVLRAFFPISHQLTFDFHTMLLSDALVTHKPIDIASIFQKHCKVADLIDRLQKNFASTDASEGLFTAYSELLSETLSKQIAWTVDDETMAVTLSDKGAFHLLLESGLIKIAL